MSMNYAKRYEGIKYFEDMAVDTVEQQIGVRLICYNGESRWALAYRIRWQALSFRYCLFVSGVPQVERKSVQRYFVVIGGDIWYTSNIAESDKLRI